VSRRLDVLLVLAVLGVAISLYLTYVAIWEEGNAFCTGIGDCVRVQQSRYARVAGIPVALLGLGMYTGLVTMLALRRWRPEVLPRPLAVWTVALAGGGVIYSGYLTWLELAVIEAICVWCVGSATVVTAIFVLAVPDLRPPSDDR
jgi:uncharacterized membrane protein